MRSSPGAAIIVLLALAIALLTVPAIGAVAFPADRMVATVLVAGVSGLRDNEISSNVTVIDESYNGMTIRVARDDTLLVQLYERDPDRTWHFDCGDSFTVVDDTIPEKYPGRHDFWVRVRGPGELRFKKIDCRDGFLIDTFAVKAIIGRDRPDDSPTSYPLWRLHAISPRISKSPSGQA